MARVASSGPMARPRTLDRVNDGPAWWRRVDTVLVGAALALALSGLLMVFSATRPDHGVSGFAIRQAIWVVFGLTAMTITMAVDYRKLKSWSPWLYGALTVVLLLVVSPLGSRSKGAQAWFQLGPISVEPSEFSKLAIIVGLAAYAARQRSGLKLRHVMFMVAMVGLHMALIVLQPDLGSALVFIAIVGGVLVAAGAPAKSLLALVLMTVVAAVAVVQLGVLKQYQLDRLGSFIDPTSDTQQSAYNLNQSKIAIGSGGLTGKGLFLGTQTNLRYVPEQHTDFIFTVVGEELGLLGSATLLGLFALLLWRIWLTSKQAGDRFGSLLCVGVLSMLAFQIFENVGMTMGIMPITGIPLPLVSYGGSSALATFVAIGLVLNVRFRSEV